MTPVMPVVIALSAEAFAGAFDGAPSAMPSNAEPFGFFFFFVRSLVESPRAVEALRSVLPPLRLVPPPVSTALRMAIAPASTREEALAAKSATAISQISFFGRFAEHKFRALGHLKTQASAFL